MVSSAIVPQPEVVYRHSAMVRITHWVNAFCLFVLLVSGLQIFNAHPTLYFGEKSEPDRAVLSMRAVEQPDGNYRGITTIGSAQFDPTGVLGLSRDASGEYEDRGFPGWITLPSYRDLATGRRWHFFFAWLFVLNGLAYLIYAAWSGHVRRDLAPTRSQLRHIGQSGAGSLPHMQATASRIVRILGLAWRPRGAVPDGVQAPLSIGELEASNGL